MQFQNVLGQEALINHFRSAIRLNKVSHAYIINGEAGLGKMKLAEAFAQALLCEKLQAEHDDNQIAFPGLEPAAPRLPEVIEPCEECISCKKASHHNHPDIIYISHEKTDIIKVDEIREQFVNTVDIKPYESKRKIYIIDDAELINEQGQNILLKTIEEPPQYVNIIMLTTNKDKLLPTVLSRCVVLNMTAVSDAKIKTYLMSKGVVEYQADMAINFASGNPGKALLIARDTEFQERIDTVTGIMKKFTDYHSKQMADIGYNLSEDEGNIGIYLDMITSFLRDVIVYKTTLDESRVHFASEMVTIRELSNMPGSAINRIINVVYEAKEKIRSKVTADLTIEMMLHRMQDIAKEYI